MSRSIAIMGRVLDQRDGLGLYCAHLLRNMIALDPHTRYQVFLATPTQSGLFREFPNARIHVLRSRSKLWWDQVLVPRAAQRLGADVIFNPKFSVPLFTRRPCAFVLQDSDWYVNPRNYPWWDNLYIRVMLPLYCRKAKRLLVISQFTLTSLAHHGILAAHKATVAYAAVSANFAAKRDPAEVARFRAAYGLPPAFILTVARAYHTGHTHSPPYPGGNLERLLRAYRLYRGRGGQLPLVVAGDRIDAYLRERGHAQEDFEGMQFVGFIPNERMHLAYQAAECFVLTKLCESFGLPILESLSSGCPAIVPRTCASPEVAGGAARLIDPYDENDIAEALLEVTASPQRREQMREQGLRRASAFSWPETARRALAVLNEMCDGRC